MFTSPKTSEMTFENPKNYRFMMLYTANDILAGCNKSK